MTRVEWSRELAIGWFMGLALVMPGLSAATVALVFGVYRKWLCNISNLHLGPLRFLLVGLLAGILSGVQLVSWGAEVQPDALSALFLGILSIFIIAFVRANRPAGAPLILCLASFAAGWGLAVLSLARPIAAHGVGAVHMTLAGAAGAAAMALPGVSGGTLLILMGLYYATIDMVAEFDWLSIFWFGIGAVLGVFIAARILAHMLQRWRRWVMAALIGLMAGSMRALLPGQWDGVTVMALGIGIAVSALLLGLRASGVGRM